MAAILPDFTREAFSRGLARCTPVPLGEPAVEALYQHYIELRRWNPRLSLIGPGTAEEVLSRHYGEALQGLQLLPDEAFAATTGFGAPAERGGGARALTALDIGSGGGFPGFVLAAACPGLAMTLVEPRERKWSFLRSACRRAGVSCKCINSRVEAPLTEALPDTIDLLTLRALSLPAPVFEALRSRLSSTGRLLLWQTLPQEDPPAGFRRLRTLALPGSERRCIGEYGP